LTNPPILENDKLTRKGLNRAPTLKAVESDLLLVRSTLASTPASGEFLLNPVLSATARTASIKSLLATASPKAATSDITLNFFQVMADNGRLYEAEKVIDDFLEIMSAHRGEVKVTITTAVALEKDLQSRLEASLKLSELAGKGKTLIIQNKINEAVLGGLIVDFGDKTVDLSVKSRVNQLNASLQGSLPISILLHLPPHLSSVSKSLLHYL
jgi:F-type H+-transporting ATPase subunit O